VKLFCFAYEDNGASYLIEAADLEAALAKLAAFRGASGEGSDDVADYQYDLDEGVLSFSYPTRVP